jgi:hypothetical protein
MTVEMDQRIKQAFEAVDFDRISSEYREQNAWRRRSRSRRALDLC